MKKIVLVFCLLAGLAAVGRAQESRQDVSLSGIGIITPFIASSTDVQLHSRYGLGALASYRYQLTPNIALEANYGLTYENKFRYEVGNSLSLGVTARVQEISGAFVRSFTYKKFNPFVEAGPAGLIFLPVRNSGTQSLDAKQQTQVGILYGGGVAYEISPSFDIRAQYRAYVTKVPNFGLGTSANEENLTTNKWWNMYVPTVGVAYHF